MAGSPFIMVEHLLKCPACSSYGLSEQCACGGKRVSSHPPKFSPEDRYADYRRRAKEAIATGGKSEADVEGRKREEEFSHE